MGLAGESCNQYLHKGSRVLVEGRLAPDQATGAPKVFQKRDGTWGSSYEVFAESVRFLTPRAKIPADGVEDLSDDDIPF